MWKLQCLSKSNLPCLMTSFYVDKLVVHIIKYIDIYFWTCSDLFRGPNYLHTFLKKCSLLQQHQLFWASSFDSARISSYINWIISIFIPAIGNMILSDLIGMFLLILFLSWKRIMKLHSTVTHYISGAFHFLHHQLKNGISKLEIPIIPITNAVLYSTKTNPGIIVQRIMQKGCGTLQILDAMLSKYIIHVGFFTIQH